MDATTSASFTSTREVLSALQGGQPPLIIDVRREQAFRAATDMIAGALWRDPERVALWAGELPRASRVVAYCVRGHEVSQGVAKALGEHGIAAKVLKGGIEEGWKAAGRDLARALAQLRRRPRDAKGRHGDVRRALRVVQGRAGGNPHVESGGVPV